MRGLTSLVEFLRKRLMLGSQYPSVEEEADAYIKELEEYLYFGEAPVVGPGAEFNDYQRGYQHAKALALKFLKGESA